MRCFHLVLAGVLVFSALSPAAASDDEPVVEAVRALLGGANAAARERAENVVQADPAGAVRALIEATRLRMTSGVDVVSSSVPPDRVGLPAPIAADEKMLVQLYDVRDLTQGKLTIEQFAARLRSIVGEGMTVDATQGGVMVVRASAPAHDRTRNFLDRLRTRDGTLYEIDARVIVAPMSATVGTQVMRARAGEVIELDEPLLCVEEWQRSGDVQIVASPRIACMQGQRASIQVGRQISFVSDFDFEIAQGSFIADPIVDVVWDGVQADFTPWSTAEGDVQLSLAVAICDVEEPLATIMTTLGAFTDPITLQVPSYVKTELSRSLVVADGGSVLVRLADGPDVRRMVLVTVRVVELSGAEATEQDDD